MQASRRSARAASVADGRRNIGRRPKAGDGGEGRVAAAQSSVSGQDPENPQGDPDPLARSEGGAGGGTRSLRVYSITLNTWLDGKIVDWPECPEGKLAWSSTWPTKMRGP